MSPSIAIRDARPGDMDAVRVLLRAYARALDFQICFQGFDDELAALPGPCLPPEGGLLVAEAGGRIVGASTALPLSAAEPELQAPFRAAGHDVARVYYYGESVLQPEWRGAASA